MFLYVSMFVSYVASIYVFLCSLLFTRLICLFVPIGSLWFSYLLCLLFGHTLCPLCRCLFFYQCFIMLFFCQHQQFLNK